MGTTRVSKWSMERSFVTAGDLYDRGKATGHVWLNESLPPSTKVIEGSNDHIRLADGLTVHYADSQELNDLSIKTNSSAHIGVRLFLEGEIDAHIGDKVIPMPTRSPQNGQWQPIASIFSQIRKETFHRKVRKGERVRKVIISMSHDWLANRDLGDEEQAAAIRRFTSCHLACKSWIPSQSALAKAAQIMHPPELPDFLLHLYIESRVLDLIAEAFYQILCPETEQDDSSLRPQDRQRISKIEAYLEKNFTQPIKASDLADVAGISVNTLQRLYQSAYGTSVSDFVRTWRMQKARHALEIDQLSIAEAAYLAGYGSPANFSTAFKRHFGISPSEASKGA